MTMLYLYFDPLPPNNNQSIHIQMSASLDSVLMLFYNPSCLLLVDILADQGSPLLQDPDMLPFSSYSSMQYPSMEPTMSSTPYYSNQNYYPQYNGDEWYSHTGIYELRKGPLEVNYEAEREEVSTVVPAVCKRTRHIPQAGRVKGEELCVVCGDKASGYHYNALTCEGCKGETSMRGCIGFEIKMFVSISSVCFFGFY